MGPVGRLFSQLMKFGLVGALGTLTNLTIFFLLVDLAGLIPTCGAIIAFAFAVTQNYFLNRAWTFARERGFPGQRMRRETDRKRSILEFVRFVLISICGLAVNLAVLNLFLHFFRFPVKTVAQMFGIVSGMSVNFAGYRWWVFHPGRPVGTRKTRVLSAVGSEDGRKSFLP